MKLEALFIALPRPILNSHHRCRTRIFDFHPAFCPTTSIGKIPPLGDDAFQSHFAGLLKNALAIFSLKKNPTRNARVATQDSLPFVRSIPLRGVRCFLKLLQREQRSEAALRGYQVDHGGSRTEGAPDGVQLPPPNEPFSRFAIAA